MPLYVALKSGRLDMIQCLLDYGAHVDQLDQHFNSFFLKKSSYDDSVIQLIVAHYLKLFIGCPGVMRLEFAKNPNLIKSLARFKKEFWIEIQKLDPMQQQRALAETDAKKISVFNDESEYQEFLATIVDNTHPIGGIFEKSTTNFFSFSKPEKTTSQEIKNSTTSFFSFYKPKKTTKQEIEARIQKESSQTASYGNERVASEGLLVR